MANEDIKILIKEEGKKTRDHFEVVAEDLEAKLDTVSEQVATNTEKITEIQETLQVMQVDLLFIKTELTQKINREEFAALEERIIKLEAKQKA